MLTGELFTASTVHWVDTQVTSGGTATFNPTDDGSASGNPLFSAFAVQFTAEVNTSVATAVPVCALKSVSADKRTLVANVIVPTVLGLLGATALFAPDGTKVHCHMTGIR